MGIQEAGDRQIVTGEYAGSIFPREERTVSMALRLDGRTAPFLVEGSVYARELEAVGTGVVRGPVLVRGDVTLTNTSTKGCQRFLAGLSTRGHLQAISAPVPLAESLTGRADAARFVIRGEVIADSVRLSNTIVFGNVRAKRVVLDSCIVLGAIIATETAEVGSSVFASVDGEAVSLLGPCSCFLASGVSRTPYVFGRHRDALQVLHDFSLRHLALCRSTAAGCGFGRSGDGKFGANRSVSCTEHAKSACPYSQVMLTTGDFVHVEGHRSVTRVEGTQHVTTEQAVPIYVLSIAGRALNFQAVADDANLIGSVMRAVLEFDHYDDVSRQQAQQEWSQELSADEIALLSLAIADGATVTV